MSTKRPRFRTWSSLLGIALGVSLWTPVAFGQLVAAPDREGFWHQDSTDILGMNEDDDSFGFSSVSGDFNNDGYPDLAIGASGEAIGDLTSAGSVHVIYGGATGLRSPGNQVWNQDSPDVQGSPEAFDLFGWSLASGDFNGDGYDDLAIGSPWESVNGDGLAGAVNVLYGGPGGLTAEGDQIFTQDTPGMEDSAEPSDTCGTSLATGDFNADGYSDLAVGCPFENLTEDDMGAVNVIYGSGTGLAVEGNQLWHQDSTDIQGVGEPGDRLGTSLTSGDFNNDGYSDLAIGVPRESVDTTEDAGAVNIIYGGMAGLSAAGDQIWVQGEDDIVDIAEVDDLLGEALATGDFNGDGFDDLAAGAPGEEVDTATEAGAVNIIYGAGGGLSSVGNQIWHQDSPGILGVAEPDDGFGSSLASGNFDNDGFDDLAITSLFEDVEGKVTIMNTGAVNVIYGRPSGLASAGNQIFTQDTDGLEGDAGDFDGYGRSLTAADLDLDGLDDLAIGVATDTFGGFDATGSVNVLHGAPPDTLLSDLARQLRALVGLQSILSGLSGLL